ncbi:MAG: hypothetical protein AAFN92_20330, partial [Bacteroidota bacterium]
MKKTAGKYPIGAEDYYTFDIFIDNANIMVSVLYGDSDINKCSVTHFTHQPGKSTQKFTTPRKLPANTIVYIFTLLKPTHISDDIIQFGVNAGEHGRAARLQLEKVDKLTGLTLPSLGKMP